MAGYRLGIAGATLTIAEPHLESGGQLEISRFPAAKMVHGR